MPRMQLPIVQYRRHRLAYSVAAVFGFLAACQGYYWLAHGNVASFFGWLFLIVGLVACCGCCWTAIRNSLVLELNQQGIMYKKDVYGWNTLRSYAIRKETGESSLSIYLVLYFNDSRNPLEIQLDWLSNSESVPEQMAAYAKFFHIGFDGIVRKEV